MDVLTFLHSREVDRQHFNRQQDDTVLMKLNENRLSYGKFVTLDGAMRKLCLRRLLFNQKPEKIQK